MGSLRTPVGPLPSSIYWRRRGVVLLLLALLGLLIWWALNLGGSGSPGSGGDDGAGGPATSISPEPDDEEDDDLVEDRPGGRDPADEDEEGDGDGTGDAEGTDDGTGEGTGGDDGTDEGTGADGADPAAPGSGDVEGIAIDDPAGPGGSADPDGTAGGPGGTGGAVAASLPRCPEGALKLSLSPVSNSYPPGELPRLRLTLTNTSSADCRTDLGHRSFALTMTRTDDGDRTIWDSTTCPTGLASAPVAVPADGATERIITWDRRRSVEDCDTRGPAAPYGTYLAEAEIDGFPVARTTFRLEED
ncbi:hypothetical protein GCM10027160_25870 [Streptomyces calidiresistens]|uniref:DUF4232 domain-containing protein n=1 Tax=Streptomyces calidiresistens TaxID=1485586 RepID=A0A7W3XXU0_9ACTN|nr:hypothetical protein [Streptomyces calidiresistens]MBB0231309.1 hypothetical protein [Streptomyces calidiresistens]